MTLLGATDSRGYVGLSLALHLGRIPIRASEIMSHRSFIDSSGRSWDVWSVQPDNIERREDAQPAAKPPVERRSRREYRVPLGRKWANGWLAFETKGERRRLAPIPTNWLELEGEGLDELCRAATPIAHARRLLK